MVHGVVVRFPHVGVLSILTCRKGFCAIKPENIMLVYLKLLIYFKQTLNSLQLLLLSCFQCGIILLVINFFNFLLLELRINIKKLSNYF